MGKISSIQWTDATWNPWHGCIKVSDGCKVFVKQLGTHLAKEMGLKDRHSGDINEWPEHLKIREFPK